MSRIYAVTIAFLTSLFFSAAYASVDEGYAWLAGQQQVDGGVYSETEGALTYQATFEALAAAEGAFNRVEANDYLTALEAESSEFISRNIMLLGPGSEQSALLSLLVSRQNASGSFSNLADDTHNVYDTAWALLALLQSSESAATQKALIYLLDQQNKDGGWSYPESFSSVNLTANVATAFVRARVAYPSIQDSLNDAIQFLSASTNNVNDTDKALALTVLSRAEAPLDLTAQLLEELNANQEANGSWNNEVYLTALVLRAEQAFKQSIVVSPQDGSIAALSGRVLLDGSKEPIAGVEVSVFGSDQVLTITDAIGRYRLSDLPQGQQTLVFTKQYFNGAVKKIALSSGATFDVGDVTLTVENSDYGLFAAQVYDAESGVGIEGSSITLSHLVDSYIFSPSDDGVLAVVPMLSAVDPYSLSVTADGYNSVEGQVSFTPGQINKVYIGMLIPGVVLNDQDVHLSSRIIDGENNDVIASATIELIADSPQQVESALDGSFNLGPLERGRHALKISVEGYNSIDVSADLPIGSSGKLPDIKLFKATQPQYDATLTVGVVVRDSISKGVVANAPVSIQVNGLEVVSGITDAAGKVDFAGIEHLNFDVLVQAQGYLALSSEITSPAYGQMSIDANVTPESDAALTVTSLAGEITNAGGDAIANAEITVLGAGNAALIGAVNRYSLKDIDSLAFSVKFKAPGYESKVVSFSTQAYGNYSFDIILDSLASDEQTLVITEIIATDFVPYEVGTMQASIQNIGIEVRQVAIRGRVVDSDSSIIAEVLAFIPGTTATQSTFMLQPGETVDLVFEWNPLQSKAQSYLFQVDALEMGSASREMPDGVVLARSEAAFSITSTFLLGGGTQFDPPLIQAGSEFDVTLGAVVRNLGNATLDAGDYQLVITDEAGVEVHSATTTYPDALALNGVAILAFGTWKPIEPAHYNIFISHTAYPDVSISGVYYVGDVASGTFILDQQVFAEGDQSTQGTISLEGVDVSDAVVSDELFELVKDSVKHGGQYVATQAVIWDKSQRCMGCHIQSQAVFGLASAQNFVDIDEEKTKYLVNTLTNAAKDDGSIVTSFTNFVKTQTGFAMWGLSEWDDKLTSFRTSYNAAKYMYDQRVIDGNRIYWLKDHDTGWFGNSAGISWAVAKSMADVIETSEREDIQNLETYSLDLAAGIGLGTELAGDIYNLSASSDSESIFVVRSGGVQKLNLKTSAVEVVYSSVETFDMAEFNNQIYISANDDLVVIDALGNTQSMPQPYQLHDLEVHNGELYGLSFTKNRLAKLNPNTLVFETVYEQGLFKSPRGIASSENGLMIANSSGYNVLAFDDTDNSVTEFAAGLLYRPRAITTVDEGFIITTEKTFKKERALQLLHTNGIAEQLFSRLPEVTRELREHAVVNGRLYTIVSGFNGVVPVKKQKIDLSHIPLFKEALEGVAINWRNSDDWNSSDRTNIALRLMVLAEAKPFVTDANELQVTSDTIDRLAVKLRSKQNSNGGWSRTYGKATDPLSTALAGFAIDYTNPSANDPSVRKTIAYLLNKQRGAGDWDGAFYTTRLGTTSAVMAYLPRALERLGGLDVGLNMTMPSNVELSNITVPPTLITPQDNGELLYNWDMEGVTASGQDIGFDIMFKGLLSGETRPAVSNVQIDFANSFTGEKITVPLMIPDVTAVTQIGLVLSTDKANYWANESVSISNLVSNVGEMFTGGLLTVEVRQAGFNSLLETLAPNTSITLAADESINVNHSWSVGVMPAGDYVVYAKVTDATGHLQVESSKIITVLPSGTDPENPTSVTYDTSIATDKYTYQAFDQVQINSRVRNQSINASNDAVLAKISIADVHGSVVFETNHVAREMLPHSMQDFADQLTLDDAISGVYTATLTLWNADVTQQITSSAARFEVNASPLSRISGHVSVSANNVSPGDELSCTDTVNNRSGQAMDNIQVQRLMVSMDTDTVINQLDESLNLSANGNWFNARAIETRPLEEGAYACVLVAKHLDEVITLGFASFVVEIKIDLETTYSLGSKGRWLILSNAAADKVGEELTTSSEQDSYLATLLNTAGWSYTLVHNAEDFAAELYSGEYAAYALLAENIKLKHDVEKVLAESVAQGRGLIVGGAVYQKKAHRDRASRHINSFLNRNFGFSLFHHKPMIGHHHYGHTVEDVLGTRIDGHGSYAEQVIVPANTYVDQAEDISLVPAAMWRTQACSAEMVAYYEGEKAHGHVKNHIHDKLHGGHLFNCAQASNHISVTAHKTVDVDDDDVSVSLNKHLSIKHCNKDIISLNIGITKTFGDDRRDNEDDHNEDDHDDDENDGRDDEDDDTGHTGGHPHCNDQIDPAVTVNQYGEGSSVYIAFDVLDEAANTHAANSGDTSITNAYAEMILHTMELVHPENIAIDSAIAVPLLMNVQNLGLETDTRLTLELADNVQVINSPDWEAATNSDGERILQKAIFLEEEMLWSERVYLQLTDEVPMAMPLTTEFMLPSLPEWQWFETQDIHLQGMASTDIDDAIIALETALANDRWNFHLKIALHKLRHAKTKWQAGKQHIAVHYMFLALYKLHHEPELRNITSKALLYELSKLN